VQADATADWRRVACEQAFPCLVADGSHAFAGARIGCRAERPPQRGRRAERVEELGRHVLESELDRLARPRARRRSLAAVACPRCEGTIAALEIEKIGGRVVAATARLHHPDA